MLESDRVINRVSRSGQFIGMFLADALDQQLRAGCMSIGGLYERSTNMKNGPRFLSWHRAKKQPLKLAAVGDLQVRGGIRSITFNVTFVHTNAHHRGHVPIQLPYSGKLSQIGKSDHFVEKLSRNAKAQHRWVWPAQILWRNLLWVALKP